jgi:hypothetical protein
MDASLIITSMIDAMSTVDIDAREKTGFIDQSSLAYAWLRVRQYDSLTVPETNRGHPPIPDGIEHACITYVRTSDGGAETSTEIIAKNSPRSSGFSN